MNKLRLVAIAAIMFFSASAFTKATNSLRFDTPQVWHLQDNADPNVAANYEAPGSESCITGDNICQITDVASPSNPSQPALSFGNPMDAKGAYSATPRP